MPGRFVQIASERELEHFYKAKNRAPFDPNYNIAPQTDISVVLQSRKSHQREIHLLRWGLIPSWAQDDKKPMINARSETIGEKPTFRESFKKQRCIVPASGFYEWKRDDETKTPYFIKPREGMFSFAAVWSSWAPNKGTAPIPTVAILTAAANPVLQAIHHRVPVHLSEDRFEQWLDLNIEGKDLGYLLQPLADEAIEFWQVDKRVNKVENNDAELMEPVAVD